MGIDWEQTLPESDDPQEAYEELLDMIERMLYDDWGPD